MFLLRSGSRQISSGQLSREEPCQPSAKQQLFTRGLHGAFLSFLAFSCQSDAAKTSFNLLLHNLLPADTSYPPGNNTNKKGRLFILLRRCRLASAQTNPPGGCAVKADYSTHEHSPRLINLLLHRDRVKLWKAIKASAHDPRGGSPFSRHRRCSDKRPQLM